jgi:hypothetical protein
MRGMGGNNEKGMIRKWVWLELIRRVWLENGVINYDKGNWKESRHSVLEGIRLSYLEVMW